MSFEMNKIVGAILMAMILALASGILADALVKPVTLAKNVYEIPIANQTAAAGGAAPAAPAGPEPLGPILASADAAAGKQVAQKCAACHTFDKGQPNRVGPNLWGIIGDQIAHDRGGFAFSSALQAHKGNWTIPDLNHWLFKPSEFAHGTKMTFVGLPKAKDRANVIAYLNSESDKPQALAALAATDMPAAKPPVPAAAPGSGKAPPANPPAATANPANPPAGHAAGAPPESGATANPTAGAKAPATSSPNAPAAASTASPSAAAPAAQ